MPIDTKISASTYQNFDGSNFTTAGVECGINLNKSKLSTYCGLGTNLINGSTGAIIDFKGSMPYGNSNLSGSFRIRNNLNHNSKSVQFRVQPANVNIPINNNTSFYADPYVAFKTDNHNNKSSTTGIFSGISTKINKTSIFVEGQLYDITKINSNTIGINAGISIPL